MYKAQKKYFFFQLVLLLFGFSNLFSNSNSDDSSLVSVTESLNEFDWTQDYKLLKNNPIQDKHSEDLFIEFVEAEDSEEEIENGYDKYLKFQNIGTKDSDIQLLDTISCKRKENIQYLMRCSGCVCSRLYLKHQVFLI